MASGEKWTTRLGFVMAATGAAVGCGNLWRFPYMVGKYGGAAFLVIYFVIVGLIAFPLLTAEVAMGRKTQSDPVGAYKILAPGSMWYIGGYLSVAVSFMWLCYLTPIFGWFMGYLIEIARGTFNSMGPEEIARYFPKFIARGGYVFSLAMSLVLMLIFIVKQGVSKGIERANNFLMPILFLLLVILVIRSLTLSGAEKGLVFYLKPDFSKISLEAVLAALGQALFSVGVAVGVGVVFGSYLKQDGSDVSRKTAMVCICDTFVAFLAGLMVFPSIFSFGLEPNVGSGLLFVTMPNVFNNIPFGNFIGVMTVILFMIAMLTSQIACFETVLCFMENNLKIQRNKGVWILASVISVMIYANANSMSLFDIFDYITSNVLLTGGALFLSIFVGWVWKPKEMLKAGDIKLNERIVSFMLKYAVPVAILVVWVSWIM